MVVDLFIAITATGELRREIHLDLQRESCSIDTLL